jgi:hypothetical protein
MYGLIEFRILEAKSYGTLYVISQAKNERLQRVSITGIGFSAFALLK